DHRTSVSSGASIGVCIVVSLRCPALPLVGYPCRLGPDVYSRGNRRPVEGAIHVAYSAQTVDRRLPGPRGRAGAGRALWQHAGGGQVAMTANREILLDIGSGKGPQKRLIAFGYAGWGPGQLDAELATGAWTSVPVDPALVFDEDRDKVWDTAYSRRGRDL